MTKQQPKYPIEKYDNGSLMYWIAMYGWELHVRLDPKFNRFEYRATKDGEQYGWYSGITDREPLERLAIKCGIGFPDEETKQ